MLRRTFCWSVAFVLIASVAYGQERYVRIEKPRDGQTVEGLPDVEGKVSDPKAKVILVVRPVGTKEYWVQPPVDVNNDGKFSSSVHIGRTEEDYGTRFQIRAVANPRRELREGQVLSAWPAAELSSEIVTVVKARLPK